MADITLAGFLINSYIMKYSEHYGMQHLTYNLHCHLHLPLQVFLFGPLHMVSCFPFEGFFKVCHQLFSGTRAIAEQISRNLSILDHLRFIKNFTNFKVSNHEQIQKLQQKMNYSKQATT
jgi:hypothetical protein